MIKKMVDGGSSVHFPELEVELLQCITDHRRHGYGMSTADFRLKGLYLAKKTNDANFYSSVAWSCAF